MSSTAPILHSLSLAQFRWISDAHYEFQSKTAIIGMNGSGKTHLLEAIHLASGGHLHYFQAPRDDASSLELSVASPLWPKKYSYQRWGGKEIYRLQWSKLSGVKYRSELPYRTVFLSPFDMNLLYFAPSVRRDYMDSILSRAYAQFPLVKREYEAAMRRRNALLKKIREGFSIPNDLEYWDRIFAEKAALYDLYRSKFAEFVSLEAERIRSFLPKYTIEFSYEMRMPLGSEKEDYISALRASRDRDIITGHTHIGPHLDDFSFQETSVLAPSNSSFEKTDTWDAATSITMLLSRGETKVLLLALKQIEILFLRKCLGLPIILLFDDVFAELDENYAEHVIDIFDVDQVIVTTQRLLPESKNWADFSCIKLKLR